MKTASELITYTGVLALFVGAGALIEGSHPPFTGIAVILGVSLLVGGKILDPKP